MNVHFKTPVSKGLKYFKTDFITKSSSLNFQTPPFIPFVFKEQNITETNSNRCITIVTQRQEQQSPLVLYGTGWLNVCGDLNRIESANPGLWPTGNCWILKTSKGYLCRLS